MRPKRARAASTMAASIASLATSASNATHSVPPPDWRAIATVSSAEASRLSTAITLAPSWAKRSTVARPLPMPSPGDWPAPTTMAIRSFKRISFHSRDRVLLQYLFVIGLVVHFHGGEHADHGTVEGDGEHQIGHVLVGKLLLDLGK